jgi:hypothetical protein
LTGTTRIHWQQLGTSPIGSIAAQLVRGYSVGTWTGPGIRSSTAAAQSNHNALGFAEATDLFTFFPAMFAGESIDSTATLIRYTLSGDANLDATIDTVDFNLLTANFSQSAKHWFTAISTMTARLILPISICSHRTSAAFNSPIQNSC